MDANRAAVDRDLWRRRSAAIRPPSWTWSARAATASSRSRTDPSGRRPGRGCPAGRAGDRLARPAEPPRSGPVRPLAPAGAHERLHRAGTRERGRFAKLEVLAVEDPRPATTFSAWRIGRSGSRVSPLTPDERAILVLHHYVGYHLSEIAELLGVPDGTIRSRLHHAHRAMRAALDAEARTTAVGGSTA